MMKGGDFADDTGAHSYRLHSGYCWHEDLGRLVHFGLHLHLHRCLRLVSLSLLLHDQNLLFPASKPEFFMPRFLMQNVTS